MDFESLELSDVAIALGIILSGFLMGFLIERIALTKLKAITNTTISIYDDLLVSSLKNIATIAGTIVGCYFATIFIPFYEAVGNQIRDIIVALFIFVLTILFARFTKIGIEVTTEKNRGLSVSSSIFSTIGKIIVYTIGILIALQSLGIEVTAIITALGIGGLAVALALQDTLENLFSGIYIIAARKIRTGDFIEFEGSEGYVQDISWRNTTIRSIGDNHTIIAPNAIISKAIVKNYHLPQKDIAVILEVGVDYGSDLDFVEETVVDVAKLIQKEVEGAKADFEPFIRFNNFIDSSITFSVILSGNEFVDQYLLKHEFIKALHKQFRKEGIAFPFPQLDVTLKRITIFS